MGCRLAYVLLCGAIHLIDNRPHMALPTPHRCVLRIASLVLGLLLVLVAPAQARDVRVGVYANAPKIFLDADGQISGIFGDFLKAIAARENWTLIPVVCEWQACLDATQQGQIDLMPDVAYSDERDQQFDFHQIPALYSWSQLYQRPGAGIQSVLDLGDKRVAVLRGSIQQSYLENLLSSFGVKPQWVLVDTLADAFTKVANREADVAAANYRFGDTLAIQLKLVETPVMFNAIQLFYATRKGYNADLLAALDRHLGPWKQQPGSVYFTVLKKWGSEPPATLVPVAFWWGLGAVVAMLLLALGFAVLLRRTVREKTHHLRESEDKLNTILDSVVSPIYIKDLGLRHLYANAAACAALGRTKAEVAGKTAFELVDAQTAEQFHHNDLQVLARGSQVTEEETLVVAGDPRTFLSAKLPLRRPDGTIYAVCGISTDITEMKKSREAIHQLAFFDPLTQLPNRRLLMDRMHQTLATRDRTAHDGALLFIDLDHFKTLNDSLGHDMGDQLLIQVAQRLRHCVRDQDTLARLGSDEFVVMVQDLSVDAHDAARQAEGIAQKIVAMLAQPYALGIHQYQSSASVGIAMFSDPLSTQEELLKRADLAMFQAKADGRNTLRFFNPDMQIQVAAQVALEAQMREGLVHDQFLLYYQPQADDTGRLLGAEVLVRWQHPQFGLVLPGQFIAVAESSGLILPLGQWILRAACQQLVRWSQQPSMAHLDLSVNVSARQFRQPNFVREVLAVLEETGAPATRLELELTESQLLDDVDSVIAKMHALQERGVRFALDDFGTGYSSLSYLKRLPLSRLKIDQSFVKDLFIDPDDTAIVKTVIALGQALQLEVIAEGVETHAQLAALKHLGCLQFQGYLLARPGPVAVVEQWHMPNAALDALE